MINTVIFKGKIRITMLFRNNNIQTKNYEIETIYMRRDLGTVPVSLLK